MVTTIEPGIMKILDWEVEYVCPQSVFSQLDSQMIRRLNDFVPDHDAPVILDCGANIGISVLNYKAHFPGSRIIAFEPDPLIVPILKRNLKRNRLDDVEVVEAAAWICQGQVPWQSDGIDGSRIVDAATDRQFRVSVPSVDLADYLDTDVDLLKLDVEGSEYEIIFHVANRLDRIKNIVVECHISQENVVQFARALETLKTSGFELGINSSGNWRDLIRQPAVLPDHWEQYIVVSGWRGRLAITEVEDGLLPYTGAKIEIQRRLLKHVNSQYLASQECYDEVNSQYLESQKLLEHLNSQYLESQKQLERSRDEVLILNAKLSANNDSTSWRLTGAMRLLGSVVRRLRR